MARRQLSKYFLEQLGKRKMASKTPLLVGTSELGRNKMADIPVTSFYCSRNHCSIKVDEDHVTIKDNNVFQITTEIQIFSNIFSYLDKQRNFY